MVENVTNVQQLIRDVCDELAEFLVEKNKAYGSSFSDPVNIFSKIGPGEQIDVRIDDKLSRLMRGAAYPGDDDVLDLLGYLVLKRVLGRMQDVEEYPVTYVNSDNIGDEIYKTVMPSILPSGCIIY